MDSLDYVTASDSSMEIENQSDDSSSGSSLFKTQCVPHAPKRRQRNTIRKLVHSPESVQARESSSDSSFEPRPLTLKAIFERFKKKKRKKRKYTPTGRPRGRPEGRKNTRRSQINKQFEDKGPAFPFLESENGRKSVPWRKILSFEQAVARGFFNYLEKLKYEYHLKESLKQMNVGEDLEKDDLDSRRYKYLDDDGSISPIEESVGEDEVATNLEHDDECDIKLVAQCIWCRECNKKYEFFGQLEDNYFIVSSEFPKKMKVYSDQEHNEETAVFKKSIKSKSVGQKTE